MVSATRRRTRATTQVIAGCSVVVVMVLVARNVWFTPGGSTVKRDDLLLPLVQPPMATDTGQPAEEDLFSWPAGTEATAVCVQGTMAYVALADRLVVYDVSIPEEPSFRGRSAKLNTTIHKIVGAGSHVYVTVGQWRVPPAHVGAGQWKSFSVLAFDVSDPGEPSLSGWVELESGVVDIALQGQALYVASGEGGLHLISIADPAHPVDAANVAFTNAIAVAVAGSYAYVSDQGDADWLPEAGGPPTPDLTAQPIETGTPVVGQPPRLHVLDVSEWPAADPEEVGALELEMDGWATAVAVAGAYAYISTFWGLGVVDVSQPSAPILLETWPTRGDRVQDLAVSSAYAYLALREADDSSPMTGVEVIDVSDPAQMSQASRVKTWFGAMAVAVAGARAFVAAGDGLHIYDVSDPANPVQLAGADKTRSWMADIAVAGQHAYIADWYRGLRVYDIGTPSMPSLVATLSLPSAERINEKAIEVGGNRAYMVADGRLAVIDLSSPGSPVLLGTSGQLRPEAQDTGARDLSLAGQYVYVATGLGIVTVDVGDPVAPTKSSELDIPENDVIIIEGSYAYVPTGEGLRVLDLSNGANPTEISRVTPKALIHGAKIGTLTFTGQYLSGPVVFDVSNPIGPVHLASHEEPSGVIWLSPNQGLLYALTERDGVKIVQVDSPPSISVIGTIAEPGYAFRVAFSGNYALIVHGDGLEVADISSPASPVVVYSEEAPG